MNSESMQYPAKKRTSFYTRVAIATFLIVFAGFAQTYYLKTLFGTRALPFYLHIHGLIFTLWFVLFFIQARLIARNRIDLHRRLGVLGAILAPIGACVAIGVAFHAGRRIYLTDPASLTRLRVRPLALDFGTSIMFLVFVTMALYFRRRTDIHKRLMVLASCSLLLPAIGRIPFLFDAAGLWGLVALTELPPLACIAYDGIKHNRLHPAFGWGGAALLSSLPSFMFIGGSNLWLRFASWLVSR